ncbi:hypothetical protein KC335_g5809 [Hortaea werneckii]|nr:hypothetical protein KC335_g5809 [Hortaea werneckii]KAI7454247.1 hypothetical protein KC368_g1778 [Hortaea werneckii]
MSTSTSSESHAHMTMAATARSPASSSDTTNQYASDPAVHPFLADNFDPADYLNSTLPSLATSSGARGTVATRSVQLPELSTQLQSLLAQLNAHTTRLSNTLNQLTDEIIPSGSRLAYEVEVLRGDTAGLTDSFNSGLRKDIEVFTSRAEGGSNGSTNGTTGDEAKAKDGSGNGTVEPEYLVRLKTLKAVRARLDAVIKVFGDAMAWPLAPSELAGVTSSIISVSAPDSDGEARDREEKGKEYVEKMRLEISELLGAGNDAAGLEAALVRIEELKQLAEVWKGTAEEKARMRIIENLSKPVEERQKALERSGKPTTLPTRGADMRYGPGVSDARTVNEGGYGFFSNLKKLRDDIYMD